MPPEAVEADRAAHDAAATAMMALLGVDIDDDALIDATSQRRQTGLFAAAHMLADAWRVIVNGPRLAAKHLDALAQVMLGSQMR